MLHEPDLSTIAALIGDPARATMLTALLSGQSLPASDLAYRAHITPQTASLHLAKLVEGGLLDVSPMGRHRYYRLKNAEVAAALEALALISPVPRVRTQRASGEYQALCYARTCYDHLAGKMGVAMTQALLAQRRVTLNDQAFVLTEQGADWLAAWKVDENELRKGRRKFAPTCLDWSEQRHHLAGALGAAVMDRLFENGWFIRIPGSRALQLTETGRQGFRQEFAVDIPNG